MHSGASRVLVTVLAAAAFASACPTGNGTVACNSDGDCSRAAVCVEGICAAAPVLHDAGPAVDDAGSGLDAGPALDGGGGASDAGPASDAGESVDGGAPFDAGGSDAGNVVDAGPPPLLAHYTFDSESSFGVVDDVSGNGHALSVAGASLTVGLAGEGLALDGNTAASAASLTVSSLGASSFTASVCVNEFGAVGPDDSAVSLGGTSPSDPGFSLELGQGSWEFVVDDGQSTRAFGVGDDTLIGTGFHCFALAVDRETGGQRAYRDGARLAQSNAALAGLSGSSILRVGGPPSCNGIIDELALFGAALDDVELGALHNPLINPGLFARYSFDDFDGARLVDVSGNNHDGVAHGLVADTGLILGGGNFTAALGGNVAFGFDTFDFTSGSFTIELCYKPVVDPAGAENLLDGGCGDGFGVCIQRQSQNFVVSLQDLAGDSFSDGSLPSVVGEMHCVELVVERADASLAVFRDGVFQVGGAAAANADFGEGPTLLGSPTTSSSPYGVMDEVRIYTRALSNSEVAALPHP